jgi:hypothetical protein
MNHLIMVSAADISAVAMTIEWGLPDGSRRRLKLLEVICQPERIANGPSPRTP